MRYTIEPREALAELPANAATLCKEGTMSSKKKLRRSRALMEVPRLKANRRSGIMLTALGGILAVLAIMGIPVLQSSGILPYENMIVSIVTFATAVCACGVLGLGVQKFTRANQKLNYIRDQFDISSEEFREL